jgi:hypothetical protein
MSFRDQNELEAVGFEGFLEFHRLAVGSSDVVPDEPGVYLFYRDSVNPPVFRELAPTRPHKGHQSRIPVDVLHEMWLSSSPVIFIGCVGGPKASRTLRRELGVPLQTVFPGSPRKGARAWHLRDAESLKAAWFATPGEDPRVVLRRFLSEFEAEHGALPFANQKPPSRSLDNSALNADVE